MFTLKDIAHEFGLKINTLRYWIKKNNDDYEYGYYDFNLLDLTQRVKIYKKTLSAKKISRNYEQIIVLDLDEFKKEFDRYVKYIEDIKARKRMGNLYWTEAAIDCYCCQMNCEQCFNNRICNSLVFKNGEPPMKNTVRKLLSLLGKPQIKNCYS